MKIRKLAFLSTTVVAGVLEAQRPTLTLTPQSAEPGSLVRVTVLTPVDSGVSVSGEMGGEPFHFIAVGPRIWHAIGPVPVDTKHEVTARVFVKTASAVDTLDAVETLPPEKPLPPAEPLAVNKEFTKPMTAAMQARIERENEKAQAVGRRAHDVPPLWTQPFLQPRTANITSPFGSGRMFNGKLTSRHLGVDFSSPAGTPVRAANRGVVALVDTFFLAGRVVYIDHGGGIVTGYFHLSRPMVTVGDTVRRGQVIGLSGATGRVTGPHLHWAARYGAVTFNPLDLLSLDPAWYGLAETKR